MDDGTLIENVKLYPFLFDKNDFRFKSKLAKASAWDEIGRKCDETGEECEKRWLILRNRYGCEKRKMKDNNASGPIWRYMPQMAFLDKHIVRRRSRGGFGSLKEFTGKLEMDTSRIVKEESTLDGDYFDGGDTVELEDPLSDKVPTVTATSSTSTVLQNYQTQLHSRPSNFEDEDLAFGRSIGYSLRRIASGKLKIRAKIEILQVLEEYLEDE